MEKRESADPEHVTYTAAKRYSRRKKLSAERVAEEKVLASIANMFIGNCFEIRTKVSFV